MCEKGGNEVKKRVAYFDWINVLACFAVVVMHVNSRFWSFSPDARWQWSLLIESLAYPAVGLFLMITGATLIDYRNRYSTAEYMKKRMLRVVLPYAAWSLLAIVFHVMKGQLTWADLSLRNLATWLLNGSYYSVYWFFAPLFACYAALPVLGAIEEKRRIRLFSYMAGLSFVTLCLMPMVSRWTQIEWNPSLNTAISGGYLIYPLLGYVLSRVEIVKKQRIAIYVLGLFGLILRMAMTWKLSLKVDMVDYAYGTYLNFPCLMQTCAVFVFFKQIRFENEKANQAARRLSAASFTVYLSHKFVMDVLDRFALEPSFIADSALHPVIWPIVVYGLCILVYALGSRLPLIKLFFP